MLSGGLLAAATAGVGFSLGSVAGFLAVLALAVRQGVLMVARLGGPAGVAAGARERVAPVVATAVITAAALAPIVAFGPVPGHEVVYPLAVVALGGLLTSTLFTLFVVPALYQRFAPADGEPTAA